MEENISPVLFRMDIAEEAEVFEKFLSDFKTSGKNIQIKDMRKALLGELAEIRNPSKRGNKIEMERIVKAFLDSSEKIKGTWVFFPWKNLFLWYLPENLHTELRTARNRNCITEEEQKMFYECPVGIAGLSVGSHAALTTVLMGGGRFMSLADPDVISGSNLNRIRCGFDEVGEKKVYVAARKIYEMNPYAELVLFPEGVSKENFGKFIMGGDLDFNAEQKIKIIVEETDNLALKVKIRMWAKENKLPVIMATDNADGVIVDVERFDLDPDLKIFGGRIEAKEIPEDAEMASEKRAEIASIIVNPADIEPRMLESVKEVGKTLYSWPQLADAATMAGVVLTYLIKRIALGEPLETQRVCISFDRMFR